MNMGILRAATKAYTQTGNHTTHPQQSKSKEEITELWHF